MTAQITGIRRQDYFPTMIFSATAGEETDKVNAGLLGHAEHTEGLAMAWMLQSATFLNGAEAALGPGWPVKFTAMTRQQVRQFLIDYGTFFNFIPVSQTRNIRWLTGCGFTFHTHPEIETDMRLFTLGPEGDRIAADPAFWADYLGTDFADSWGD